MYFRLSLLSFFLTITQLSIAQFGALEVGTGSSTNVGIELVDFDNDSKPDVLFGQYNSGEADGKILWIRNNGEGDFGAEAIIIDSLGRILDFKVADINKDGLQDIVVADAFVTRGGPFGPDIDTRVLWCENLGGGSMGPPKIIRTIRLYNFHAAIHLDDLNNDGSIDIAVSFRDEDYCYYFRNVSNGTSWGSDSFGGTTIGSALLNSPVTIVSADFKSGGNKELIVGDFERVHVFEYRSGTYEGTSNILKPMAFPTLARQNSNTVRIIDVDDDGDKDIVSVGNQAVNGSLDIVWWQYNGNLTNFSSRASLIPGSGITNFDVADLDGDGDDDYVIINTSNKLSWVEQSGNMVFASAKKIAVTGNLPDNIGLMDMDGDGDIDIVSSKDINGNITWYENFIGSSNKMSGLVYFDANQNKVKDIGEVGIDFVKLNQAPNGSLAFSDSGLYEFTSDTGIHTVDLVLPTNWSLTTDSNSYTRRLIDTTNVYDSLDFGLHPSVINTDLQIDLAGGFPRCDRQVPYWITVKNKGSDRPDGLVSLDLHDSLTYVSANLTPDSINGQVLYWHFDSLFFFTEFRIELLVQMPDFNSLGDTFVSDLSVVDLATAGTNWMYSDSLMQELACAYDPNDKIVSPAGNVSPGTVLDYTVRFQNTGNDTAFFVMIRDQLSEHLDVSTLTILGSSHPVSTKLEPDDELVFTFSDIKLVDSTTNFNASIGFVKFRIALKSGLPIGTVINNAAGIYFDSNPAIVTNTTTNTITCVDTPIDLGPDTTVCANDSLLLDAVNTTYEYVWSTGDTTVTVTIEGKDLSAGDTEIIVEGTSPLGCLLTDTVVVTKAEGVSFSLIADTSICMGDSITYQGPSGSNQTYLWSSGATTLNATYGPGSTVVDSTLWLQVTDSNNCATRDSSLLTIRSLPIVDLGGDQRNCEDSTFQLDAGIGHANIMWWNNSFTGQVLSLSASGLGIGDSLIGVTVTDASGCQNEDSALLSVQPLPIFDLGNDTVLCRDDSILLDAGAGVFTYTWNNGSLTAQINVLGRNLAIGDTSIYVTKLDSIACAAYDTIKITNRDLPAIGIMSDTTICAYDSISITAGPSIYDYNWNVDPSVDSSIVFRGSPQNHLIRVVAEDAFGCERSDSMNVLIPALPITGLGEDTSICANETIQFSATPDLNYLWMNGATVDEIELIGEVLGAIDTLVSVQVTDTNGCINSDSLTLTINELPLIDIGEDRKLCEGEQLTLSVPSMLDSVLWSTGQNTDSIVLNGNQFPLGDTLIEVFVVGMNGCSNTDSIKLTVEICIGVNEIDEAETISVYPNPTNGLFTFQRSTSKEGRLVIFNSIGEVVRDINMSGSKTQQLDLNNEATGIYFVVYSNGDSSRTIKVVVD